MPGGGLPWQVHQFSGHKEGRGPRYAAAMGLLVLGTAWWWNSSKKEQMQVQDAAVARVGKHGEKAEYGQDYTPAKGDRFPGIPGTDTNAGGGHSGGVKS